MLGDMLKPENMKASDTLFELRNLNYEGLLKRATGQKLLIDDYEDAIKENLNEIADLKIELENIRTKYYLIKDKLERLETTLLVNTGN